MKKLFSEAPDAPQSVANRAVRIIEKHLRIHRVERTRDLPEEAKVRLYRDLRFLFEGGPESPHGDGEGKSSGVRGFFSRLWEKIEDFLSMADCSRECGGLTAFSWLYLGDSGRLAATPWTNASSTCDELS